MWLLEQISPLLFKNTLTHCAASIVQITFNLCRPNHDSKLQTCHQWMLALQNSKKASIETKWLMKYVTDDWQDVQNCRLHSMPIYMNTLVNARMKLQDTQRHTNMLMLRIPFAKRNEQALQSATWSRSRATYRHTHNIRWNAHAI